MGRRRPSGDVGSGTLASPRDWRPGSTRNRGRAWVIGSPTVMCGWKRRPSLSDSLTPRFHVIRRCRAGCSGASPRRPAVMPRRMVAGSISIGSSRSRTACRSGFGANLSLAERGSDIAASAYAVELHSWMVQPDPGQQVPLYSGFAHLRQAGPAGWGRKVFFSSEQGPSSVFRSVRYRFS